MAAHLTVTAYLPDELIATLRARVDRATKHDSMRAIVNELLAVAGPAKRGMVRAALASITASQTVTCSASGGAPDDTLVIGGTTLTNKASPANQSEFADAATDALLALSVVNCINAHTVLQKICWAAVTTSASGILTIYSVFPGPIGNLITLAETGNGFTLGAAALAAGASDEVDAYEFGWNTRLHVTA